MFVFHEMFYEISVAVFLDWRQGLASGVTPKYTNMLVSPTQNSGVRGIAQRQPSTPGILRYSGI